MQDEAATSSVATEAVESQAAQDISTLSPDERSSWRLTGKFPAEKEKPAASATVANEEKPADTGAKKPPQDPKSQTPSEGANTHSEEDPKPTSKAGKRIAQLIAEKKDLERRLAEAKPPEAKPEPAATKAEEKSEKLRPEPMPDDKNKDGSSKYKTYEEYNADRIEWGVEKALRDRDQKATVAAKDAEIEKRNKAVEDSWRTRVNAAREKHTDFDTVALNKDLPVKAGSVVDSFILDSEVGTEILYYLGQHQDELDKINAMPPWKQARVMMKLELDCEAAAATPAAPQKSEKQPEQEVVTSKAPKPIREVGGRGGAPADEEAAAVEHNDFNTFRKVVNGREMNLRKGR